MASGLSRLPNRFPVGTKFVIEGRRGVYSKYLEFPDGSFFPLPSRPVKRKTAGRIRRRGAPARRS